ncbi:hypothetical protein EGM51_17875 [Verrucomicrobia bacterium S94]|nr:hypothetical protein EGM51_17875 [Verrucomicrobia bacterium S94]
MMMKAVHYKRRILFPCMLMALTGLPAIRSVAEDFSQLHTSREFTLSDQKTISLKVLDWNEQRKQFRVENEAGRTSWISPKHFSDEDRAYLKEWIAAKWFLSNDRLYVSAKRTDRNDHVWYDISIQNKTPLDYEKVAMKYEVLRVLDNYDTGGQDTINVPGKIFIGRIHAGGRRDFKTQPVKAAETYKMVYSPEPVRITSGVGYTYTNEVPRKTGKQNVTGIRLQFHGPKLNGVQIVKEVFIDN